MLHLQAEQADPVPETQQIASVRSHRSAVGRARAPSNVDHLLELRFAVVQDFGARIEKRVGNLLQFGLAGLAALFECHVQSVLSNP